MGVSIRRSVVSTIIRVCTVTTYVPAIEFVLFCSFSISKVEVDGMDCGGWKMGCLCISGGSNVRVGQVGLIEKYCRYLFYGRNVPHKPMAPQTPKSGGRSHSKGTRAPIRAIFPSAEKNMSPFLLRGGIIVGNARPVTVDSDIRPMIREEGRNIRMKKMSTRFQSSETSAASINPNHQKQQSWEHTLPRIKSRTYQSHQKVDLESQQHLTSSHDTYHFKPTETPTRTHLSLTMCCRRGPRRTPALVRAWAKYREYRAEKAGVIKNDESGVPPTISVSRSANEEMGRRAEVDPPSYDEVLTSDRAGMVVVSREKDKVDGGRGDACSHDGFARLDGKTETARLAPRGCRSGRERKEARGCCRGRV